MMTAEEAIDCAESMFAEMWEILRERGLFYPGQYEQPAEFSVLSAVMKKYLIYLTAKKPDDFNAEVLDRLSDEIGNEFFELLCRRGDNFYADISHSLQMKNCYFIFLGILATAKNDIESKIIAKNILFHSNRTFCPSNPRFPVIRDEQKKSGADFHDLGPISSPSYIDEVVKLSLFQLTEADLADDEYESLIESAIDMASPATINSYFQVLSRKPEVLTKKLLTELESDKLDEVRQKVVLSLLFRLELGRIGISEEGLEYLGRRFDLGEFNDPTKFAERITADGKIGIFDSNKNLEGFVAVEHQDFQQEKRSERSRKEVLAISSEMLFTPKVDDTEEDESRRQHLLREFLDGYYETYIIGFRERTGVQFNNLNLQEQGWALSYLCESDAENKERFYNLVKKYGENALKTFIAVEYGSDMGHQIIEFSDYMTEAEVEGFFDSFANISSAAEELSHFLKTSLGLIGTKLAYLH